MNGSGSHSVARIAMPIVFVWLAVAALVVSLVGLASPARASHAGGDTTTLHPLTEGSVMLDGALDGSYAHVAVMTEDGAAGETVGNVYMVYNEEGCAIDSADAGDRQLCVFVQLLGGRTIDDDPQLRVRTSAGASLAERGVAYNADRSAIEFAVEYSCKPEGEGFGLSLDFSNPGAEADEGLRARLVGQPDSLAVGLMIGCPQAEETPTPTPTPTQTVSPAASPTPRGSVQGNRGTPAPAGGVLPNTSADGAATQGILMLTAVLLLGSAAALTSPKVLAIRKRR